MFKNINKEIFAGSNSNNKSLRSGDQRLNNDVDNDFGHVNETTKIEILIDEQAEKKELQLGDQIEAIGFSNKAFEMTEVLQRNHIINPSGTLWDSSYTAGYILNSYELPKVLMNTEFMRQKMSNFYGLRTEMEFTIKINPTPFIAGALAVVLHPTGTSPSQLSSWTYYPHELINLPIVNNATISIPYFSELEAYILPNDAPWTVSLIVVSPLRSAASSLTLEVNAFVRFKNPELMVPVLNNLIPGPTMTIDTVVSKRRAYAQAGESNEL
jgi:hypothetical protein